MCETRRILAGTQLQWNHMQCCHLPFWFDPLHYAPLTGQLTEVDLPTPLAHVREAGVAKVAVVSPCPSSKPGNFTVHAVSRALVAASRLRVYHGWDRDMALTEGLRAARPTAVSRKQRLTHDNLGALDAAGLEVGGQHASRVRHVRVPGQEKVHDTYTAGTSNAYRAEKQQGLQPFPAGKVVAKCPSLHMHWWWCSLT